METHKHSGRFFALHAHFYQPPRENPWTGAIPPQPSAWPFHDWNSRIARECYLPNSAARINDSSGRALEFENNYLNMNFNFGPTLIGWLERNYPACYARIIEAGRRSRSECGHSNAIAQAYNHMIMPLASFQDQLTQALWGIKDYERRFGFKPEAMWLPETAANDDTLRLMIDLGMKYVILSPYQADSVRESGAEDWEDVSRGDMDTTRPYAWYDTMPNGEKAPGRSLAIFFSAGPLSKAAAFEGLLKDSGALADRVEACFKHGAAGPQLVSMAVDGETFGHHHKFADMTLAHAFLHEFKKRRIEHVNYGRYLRDNPPQWEAQIKSGPDGEGTAWSCAHGVRRWKGGCDCGREGNTSLNWRLPMRAALNTLRDASAAVYAAEAAKLFRDPWGARNAYASLLPGPAAATEKEFFGEHTDSELSKAEKKRALELLEMQKNSMFMFTSCGWFFSDISRIEAMQNLRYAARVAETLHDLGFETADKPFLSLLEMAHSNYPETENGLKLYGKILSENALARQKAAALLIAEILLSSEPADGAAPLHIEERMNHAGTLCMRGVIMAPGADGPSPFAFCYLRHEEEFPIMFFTEPADMPRIKEIFKLGDPGEIIAALEKDGFADRICFEDFSWEEKTLYAWMLADAAKHSHASTILRILDDYLYLLMRLPERTLASWAPLRAQAAAYARQAADLAFKDASRLPSQDKLERLSTLAARLKEAGLEAGFEPSPEAAAALATKLTGEAVAGPSPDTLLPLLHLLKAARALGSGDLLFHLQNGLAELFAVIGKKSAPADCVPALKELYSLSDILIDRFNLKLDEMGTVPSA